MAKKEKFQKQKSVGAPAAPAEGAGAPWQKFLLWGALPWALFVLHAVLKTFPLSGDLFASVLPSQSFFPAFSVLLFDAKTLLIWAGLAAGALGCGHHLLRFLKIESRSAPERLVFSMALGYALFAFLALALAALHLLYAPLLALLWGLGGFLFVQILRREETRSFLKESGSALKETLFGRQNAFLLRIFVWIFLALSLLMAFVPELFYDALVYHLGVPNLYLQEHGLVRIPGATSRFPLLWQMLYSYGLALSDEGVAKLLHVSSGFLLIFSLAGFSARFTPLSPSLRLLPGLLFLSVPMVQMNLWTGGIDIGGSLFAWLALYAFCAWAEERRILPLPEHPAPSGGWLLLSALMAGFAFGSKYQGGIVGAGIFLVFCPLAFWGLRMEKKEILKAGTIFLSVLTLSVLPWLLKNFWDTGNPLFPFLGSLFKGLGLQKIDLDPEQMTALMGENRRFLTNGWPEHWRLPWKLTFESQGSLSHPGPFFLAFLPFAALAWREGQGLWLKILALFTSLFFAFSFSSTHLTRYHLQGYPALCLLFALGFSVLWERRWAVLKWIFTLLLVLVLLENLQTSLWIVQSSYKPWDVLAGRESRADYRAYTHPGLNPYPSNVMFRWMERHLPAGSRTLFIGESKNFDLERRYLYTDVHGRNPLMDWCGSAGSTDELYAHFRQAGITHLLVNFMEAHRTYGYKMIKWRESQLALFGRFWDEHVREVRRERIPERFFQGASVILLYEVLEGPEAAKKGGPPPNPLLVLEEMQPK